jgi:hypothetical protein
MSLSSDLFHAQENFLSAEEVEALYEFVQNRDSTESKTTSILDKIVQFCQFHNETSLNLDVDWSKPLLKDYTGYESMVESMMTPDHAIHYGNIFNEDPPKWTVIVMASNRNQVQGGELVFRNWPATPYKDNFGAWIGDTTQPHQPQWINELGTIVIFPSMCDHGFSLVTSGEQKRVKIQFTGPQWK